MNSQSLSSNVYEVLYALVKVNKQNLNCVLHIGHEKLTTVAYLKDIIRANENKRIEWDKRR